MKVVILAGGLGTRISEESFLVPKPMIRIGDQPILWHIMKHFSSYGFNDFIICCGYKQHVIKDYFNNYPLYTSNVTFDFSKNPIKEFHEQTDLWKVTLIDTGLNTMTGGRLKQIQKYLDGDTFLMTYGDGVSNIDLNELLKHHITHQKLVTISAVQPSGRFGKIEIDSDSSIKSFKEKDKDDSGWINGGFMVINKRVLDMIDGNDVVFEHEPLERLTQMKQMSAYKHHGFWQCMDTMRDKDYLEKLWISNHAPWKVW